MSENINFSENKFIVEEWFDSPDSAIIKHELIDVDMAGYIQDKNISFEDKKRIKKMMKNRTQGNKIETTYVLGKKSKSEYLGRWMAKEGVGLQGLPRDIRSALAKPYYWDVDLKNCQIVILRDLCEKNGWKNKYITELCNNREKLFEEITQFHIDKGETIDRDEIKTMFIRILFGGNRNTTHHEFINDKFFPEVNSVMKNVNALYPEAYKLAKKNKPKNVDGCCLAYILQTEERKCLMALDRCLTKHNRILSVYIHDGGYVNKLEGEVEFPKDILRNCEQYILEQTGFMLDLVVKPIETSFKLPNRVEINEDKSYEKMKFKFEFKHFKCLNRSRFYQLVDDDKFIIRTKGDLITSFEHLQYEDLFESKSGAISIKKKSFISRWVVDPDIKVFIDVDFVPPPGKIKNGYYNLWNGFAVDKIIIGAGMQDEDGCDVIKNHLKLLLNNDEKGFEYLMKWLAQLFQNPGTKIGIAWLFKTIQGMGKGWFFNLLQRMIGSQYCVLTADPEKDLFGNFNDLLENKLIVAFDEMRGSNGLKYNDQIKNMIDDTLDKVKTKYVKSNSEIKSYSRYLFFTNNEFPIKIEQSDRRFVTYECTQKSRPEFTYLQSLWNILDNHNALRTFYDELLSIDVTGFDWVVERPFTEYSEDLKSNYLSKEACFMADFVSHKSHLHRAPFDISLRELFESFGDYLKGETTGNVTYVTTFRKFGHAIKKLELNGFTKFIGPYKTVNFHVDLELLSTAVSAFVE